MKSLGIISLALLSIAFGTQAQTPVFSQYYSSGLYLNPALAGLEKDTYLGMNYRSQWNNLNLPFSTFQFSFIQPITRQGARKKHLGGVGISFLNDIAGANKEFVTQGISIAAAHNVHLNRHGNNIIALAVQAGASQQRFNSNELRWSSQYSSSEGYDPSMPGETALMNQRIFHPQLNAGMMWYYTNKQRNLSHYSTSVYNGIAVSNLIRPASYFPGAQTSMSLLYKVHGGLTSTWSRKMDLSPNYLIQLQDKNIQVNVGMYVSYAILNPSGRTKGGSTKVTLGGWYRLRDAAIVSTGISNAVWNLGFSYDSNVFAMSKAFGYGSAYELSMAYKIASKNGFKRFSSPLI